MRFHDFHWEHAKYDAFQAYAQSKLANVLFAKELHRRLRENNIANVNVYTLHPGMIKTDLGRHISDTYGVIVFTAIKLIAGLSYFFVKSPIQGAQTTIHCSVDEKCAEESGLYYAECTLKEPGESAKKEDAKKLWEESLKLVELPKDYNPFV